jgi:putative transposase
MRFIDEHRDRYAVALLLRVLDITTSTFHAWTARAAAPCDRDEVDRGLLSNIHDIWTTSGHTYGADRVHQQLRRDGVRVGRKRGERLMAGQGWQDAFLRRGWRGGSTRQNPKHTPAPDLVNRNFTASACASSPRTGVAGAAVRIVLTVVPDLAWAIVAGGPHE